MTRTSSSVPDGRSSTRPVSPRRACAAATASRTAADDAHGLAVRHRDVLQDLGQHRDDPGEVGQALAGLGHAGHHAQRGEQAVARGRDRGEHDVPGLLAAEGEPARAQLLEHVAVADLRAAQVDAALTHGHVQAEVAHHGGDHRVVDELARLLHRHGQHGHQLVAVDRAPVGVDRETAVGVAVVRDAEVRSVGADGGPQGLEVGRAHAVVDVEPVRLGGHRDDLRAGPGVALGGDGRRGTVCAVDDDPQAGQRLRRCSPAGARCTGPRRRARRAPGRSPIRSGGPTAGRGPARRRARGRRAACARPRRTA